MQTPPQPAPACIAGSPLFVLLQDLIACGKGELFGPNTSRSHDALRRRSRAWARNWLTVVCRRPEKDRLPHRSTAEGQLPTINCSALDLDQLTAANRSV